MLFSLTVCATSCYNRTYVELKRHRQASALRENAQRYNRTYVELKLDELTQARIIRDSYNRTYVELKPKKRRRGRGFRWLL